MEKNLTENRANPRSEGFVAQGSALKMAQISQRSRAKSKHAITLSGFAKIAGEFSFFQEKNI